MVIAAGNSILTVTKWTSPKWNANDWNGGEYRIATRTVKRKFCPTIERHLCDNLPNFNWHAFLCARHADVAGPEGYD
jgi:hypothetical protein